LIHGAHQDLQPGKTQPKKIGSWLEWLDVTRSPSFQPLQPTSNFFGLYFSWLEMAEGLGVPHEWVPLGYNGAVHPIFEVKFFIK
jgi:hypothetical protein